MPTANPSGKATTPRKRTTPAAKKAAPAAAKETEVQTEAYTIVLEHVGTTKSYEKFAVPAGNGCAGNFYAPLGTKKAAVRIIG